MTKEELGGRESILGSLLFFAGFAWFVLNLHDLVTRYLYMFSLSWFPFLAIIPPFLYPVARRIASIMQAMIVPGIVLASSIVGRILLGFFNSGQFAVADDIALLASLSSFLMLACSFFDLRSLHTALAAPISKRDGELGAIADLSAPMLVSALCFAIGGTVASLEPVIAGVLVFASILARRWARAPAESGSDSLLSITIHQAPAPSRHRPVERLTLLVHVTSGIYLAFLACFLGGLVLPRTSILSGSPIDGATWRMVLVSALGASAGLALATCAKDNNRSPDLGGRWKSWLYIALAAALSVTTGILTVATFIGHAIAVQGIPALFIVPAFHMAQAARRVPNSRIHGATQPLACAWNGVLASLMLGAGGIALTLLMRAGMVAEMAVVACIALVSASLLEQRH